jgi:hypothetical protein
MSSTIDAALASWRDTATARAIRDDWATVFAASGTRPHE